MYPSAIFFGVKRTLILGRKCILLLMGRAGYIPSLGWASCFDPIALTVRDPAPPLLLLLGRLSDLVCMRIMHVYLVLVPMILPQLANTDLLFFGASHCSYVGRADSGISRVIHGTTALLYQS